MVKLVLSDKQYEHIDNKCRHLMIQGSAGSGKTIFACTKVILYALEHDNARIGVFRQTLPSLKDTAWREIRELLIKYQINYNENKSDAIITLSNGSTISFKPLDTDEKIRSLNLDFVYVEQAEEISEEAYIELDLRIRNNIAQSDYGQMLLVVQPSKKTHWLYRLFYQYKENDPDYDKIHFSYLDNPFLPDEQRKVYEGLKETNYEKYLTHTKGLWISNSKQIFTDNWSVGFDRNFFDFYVGGIDWGYNAPACFLLIGFYDEEAYVLDEVYKTEMTTMDFLDEINIVLDKYDLDYNDLDAIYADSADPEKIEVFSREGLPVYPSVKNVKDKITTTRETRIHVKENCVNLIRELPMYEWKKDRITGEVLDEPMKKDDHSIDALCYCVYGVRGKLSDNSPVSNINWSQIKIY